MLQHCLLYSFLVLEVILAFHPRLSPSILRHRTVPIGASLASTSSKNAISAHGKVPFGRQPQPSVLSDDFGKWLTLKIKNSESKSDLIRYWRKHSENFNNIHIGAFWNTFGKLQDDIIKVEDFSPEIEITMERLPYLSGKTLTSTANGLAKAGCLGKNSELSEKLVLAFTACIDDLSPRELPTIVWSFAKAFNLDLQKENKTYDDFAFRDLYDVIAWRAIHSLPYFTTQGLANVAWGFASVGQISEASLCFFEELELVMVQEAADFTPQELANVAWAYARLGLVNATFAISAIAESARSRLAKFSSIELAMFGWSFAVLDHRVASETLFGGSSQYARLCEAAIVRSRSGDKGVLTQLHQWELYRRECGGTWQSFSPKLQHRCRDAFFDEPVPEPSTLENGVATALRSMGFRTQQKVRTSEGYVIDIYAETKGGRRSVAVEVDGPHCFFGKDNCHLRGSRQLKKRQLIFFGSRLLSIPYWECPGNSLETWTYLSAAFVSQAPAWSASISKRRTVQSLSSSTQKPTIPAFIGTTAPNVRGVVTDQSVTKRRRNLTVWASLENRTFGKKLHPLSVIDKAASSKMAIVGEVYSQHPVVRLELAILRRMVEQLGATGTGRGGKVFVLLEHFNQEQQHLLDAFMAGDMLFKDLVQEYLVGDEGHDIEAYKSLLEFARDYTASRRGVEIKLIGSILPRALARKAVSEGIESTLKEAVASGYVAEGESCAASDNNYRYFESLCRGTSMFNASFETTGMAKSIFPSHVIKACSIANRLSQILDDDDGHSKYLVLSGASHVVYNFGVLERVFEKRPQLRNVSYRIVARRMEGKIKPGPSGLRSIYGTENDPADVAFQFRT